MLFLPVARSVIYCRLLRSIRPAAAASGESPTVPNRVESWNNMIAARRLERAVRQQVTFTRRDKLVEFSNADVANRESGYFSYSTSVLDVVRPPSSIRNTAS